MTASWLAYLPRHVINELARSPNASRVGQDRRFEAVALFADVSGFTPMSEALSTIGTQGAEQLTAILNSYFGPMIDLIHAYGGSVEKFGGDSMTVLFPFKRSRRAATARRAAQCALEMQARMGVYAAIATSVGVFSLHMKAGLALGSVLATTIGDPAIRLEYIVAGEAIDRCAEAEHEAQAGDVVVDGALLRVIGAAEHIPLRAGFSRLVRLGRRSRPIASQEPDPSAATPVLAQDLAQRLVPYFHPTITQRLLAGQAGFVNEHRKVTVLFVRFGGFDYDHDAQVSAKLQHYLGEVIHIIQRYDGYLSRVDMGDKGSKYIVLFGAPVAHEDDEERALRCALELCAHPVPPCIGVTTGFVYCGQVGSEVRQEYTAMGDSMNLAARLMQVANPRQILVHAPTQRAVAETFVFEQLAPVSVKGKLEPVPVWNVSGVVVPPALMLHEPTYTLPMIGRERELAVAQDSIAQVARGEGHLLGIAAEAGMGKSRLAAEIIGHAVRRGFSGYGGSCQSYGTASSYLVWRDVWRGLFGIDGSATTEVQIRQLEAHLTTLDSRLLGRMPLLGVALNITIPDNELTEPLEPQLRAELLRTLLLDCLRAHVASGRSPLLIVLEDCHWIDPLSQELLEFIGRNLGDLPLLLLVIYRPSDSPHAQPHWATRLPHFTELRLLELTPSEANAMIHQKLRQLQPDGEPISEALVERLATRSEGNPFYLEELINFIRDRGIDLHDTRALADLALPGSLHSLIASRIDQLSEPEKTTLKVASVVGRLFRERWLWGSYPQVGAPAVVRQHLQRLSVLDITPLDKADPELEYIFKHVTIQEVTYESLTFALRGTLHEHVGQFIERSYAESLGHYLDVLAYHYSRTSNLHKQRFYLRRAGDAAKAAYANGAAIEYYRRLLALLPDNEQDEQDERSQVLYELADVSQLVGQWTEAEALYRQALDRAQVTGNRRVQASCQQGLGTLLSNTQSYTEALPWLEAARMDFAELHDVAGVCRALERASYAHYHRGDYDGALRCAEEQLALARTNNDQISYSTALHNIALVYWWGRNDYARALDYLELVLDIARTHSYARGVILASSDMAGVYWQQGNFAQALLALVPALKLASEIGYLQALGFMIGNAGELYRQQGQYDAALACYGRGLQIAVELNDRPTIHPILGNIGIIRAAQGDWRAAESLFLHAIALGRALDIPYYLCEDLQRLAELYARQGRYSEAVRINEEALALATEVSQQEMRFAAQLLAVRLRIALGEDNVGAAADALVTLRDAWPEPAEQASITFECWRLWGDNADRQRAAVIYRELYTTTPNVEYRERYAELTGEILLPPPPLPPLSETLLGPPLDLKATLARAGVSDER